MGEAEGSAGARGAFELFATLQRHAAAGGDAAKKSCDETSAAPQPVVTLGEPDAVPPDVHYGHRGLRSLEAFSLSPFGLRSLATPVSQRRAPPRWKKGD